MGFSRDRFISLLVGFLVVLGTVPAHAQSGDAAAAQALFETGKRLLAENKAAEACPKLEESLKLDPAIGTRFQLARCYEVVGRVASAWTLYLEVAAEARTLGQGDRETFARGEASRLKPKLSTLTIVVPQEARAAGLTVTRNQTPVGAGQWDIAIPVDPGQYQIEVKAPGKKPWVGSVEVRGEGAKESLTIPKLADAPEEAAAVSDAGLTQGAPPEVDTPASDRQFTTLQWAGLGGVAVGVVALGVGGVFALSAKAKHDDSGCGDNGACPDEDALKKNEDARQAANVATVAMIAGGVFAAAGAAVFLFAPTDESSVSLRLAPVVAPGGAAFSLLGRF